MEKINYERFEREFGQIITPLIGTLKRIYISPQDDPNYKDCPSAVAELYVKKKDLKTILSGDLTVFPVFQVRAFGKDNVALEALFDEDISNIVADTVQKLKYKTKT